MSAEQRWADRKEWEQERGEIEIKSRWVIARAWGEICDVKNCGCVAVYGREVGLVVNKTGAKFSLCEDHNDDEVAFGLYERMRRE